MGLILAPLNTSTNKMSCRTSELKSSYTLLYLLQLVLSYRDPEEMMAEGACRSSTSALALGTALCAHVESAASP